MQLLKLPDGNFVNLELIELIEILDPVSLKNIKATQNTIAVYFCGGRKFYYRGENASQIIAFCQRNCISLSLAEESNQEER